MTNYSSAELAQILKENGFKSTPEYVARFRNGIENGRYIITESEIPAAAATPEGAINTLIAGEHDTIRQYEDQLIVLRRAGAEHAIRVVEDIIKEEYEHVGELQLVLAELANGSKKAIEDGKKEAAENTTTLAEEDEPEISELEKKDDEDDDDDESEESESKEEKSDSDDEDEDDDDDDEDEEDDDEKSESEESDEDKDEDKKEDELTEGYSDYELYKLLESRGYATSRANLDAFKYRILTESARVATKTKGKTITPVKATKKSGCNKKECIDEKNKAGAQKAIAKGISVKATAEKPKLVKASGTKAKPEPKDLQKKTVKIRKITDTKATAKKTTKKKSK